MNRVSLRCVCWGGHVETKERKGKGRGRLSPGKKWHPRPSLGPTASYQGRVAGGESLLLLPRAPAPGPRLPGCPQEALLWREGPPGSSHHVSPSNSQMQIEIRACKVAMRGLQPLRCCRLSLLPQHPGSSALSRSALSTGSCPGLHAQDPSSSSPTDRTRPEGNREPAPRREAPSEAEFSGAEQG